MINVNELINDELICEGMSRPKHIFDDGELKFSDIRDVLTKIFSGGLTIEEQIDGIKIMVTYKDGEFKIAKDLHDLQKPFATSKANAKMYGIDKETAIAFENSIKDLLDALSELDDIQLNRFFANGLNYMVCTIICPPADRVLDYKNKCFVTLDKIICYNDAFKEVGEDTKSTKELVNILNANDALQQANCEITKPKILRIKNLKTCREVLNNILAKLNEFIDGVGWKCSLNGYIQDRYSRHIVNKALEHGLDVSRNSDFVNELAARLSNISGRKPTKNDLVTFAKREGVNCNCLEYKDFINDLEQNCESKNDEIIKPIESLIAYAALMLMQNITGYMCVDPSESANKALAGIGEDILAYNEKDIDAMTPEMLCNFKKALSKIEAYHSMMPANGVLIKFKGKVYKLVPKFGDADDLLSIIKYK